MSYSEAIRWLNYLKAVIHFNSDVSADQDDALITPVAVINSVGLQSVLDMVISASWETVEEVITVIWLSIYL